MTHRGPFQPLLFCDSVILRAPPALHQPDRKRAGWEAGLGVCKPGVHGFVALPEEEENKVAREEARSCLQVLSVRLLCSSVSCGHEVP